MSLNNLVGQTYTFEDGNSLEVIQVKQRDDGDWVTIHVHKVSCIPKKEVMPEREFVKSFGHLFGLKDPPQY